MTIVNATRDTLNAAIDFDSPFRVLSGGRIETYLPNVYGPEVYLLVDKEGNGVGSEEIEGDGWSPVTGYSGQHGYSGPCMHTSEYLGGGMARDVLEDTGAVYVVTTVESVPDWEIDEEDEEDVFAGQVIQDNPAGWMLLRLAQ